MTNAEIRRKYKRKMYHYNNPHTTRDYTGPTQQTQSKYGYFGSKSSQCPRQPKSKKAVTLPSFKLPD